MTKFISDEEVDRALAFLRDSAGELGQAVAHSIRAEKMVGHTEALLFAAAEGGSAEARKAAARSDPRYVKAIEEAAHWAGERAKLYGLREAASMRIEAWRSQAANFRAMKI